jgi:hypothetical protein
MPSRRFPPPWTVEEQEACFIVWDANARGGLANGYFTPREIGYETSALSVYSPHQSPPKVIGQAPTPFSRLAGGKRRQYPTDCSEPCSAPSVG